MYFRLIGIEYGRNLVVNDKIHVRGWGQIVIGDDFRFSSGGCINPICRNIRGAFYLNSCHAKIIIGDRVGISSACLWAKDEITIGHDVKIGGDCLILDNDAHPVDYIARRLEENNNTEGSRAIGTAPVRIGDDVWIGARCIILKGVTIGARSIIAAGSVVVSSIPEDVIAGGNPCKVLRAIRSNGDRKIN